MIWLLLPLAVLAILGISWWGADIIFHPPKMLHELPRPEEFGLRYEKVALRTEGGLTLRAWAIPAASETDRTILLCHGWGDNKGDALRRLHWLQKRFNLFLFDSRGHGESEGSFSTIGCLEAFDFTAAMRYLKESRPQWSKRLGVCGLSMGAAMAVYGMAHEPLLRCAVVEAPYLSFNKVVRRFAWNGFRLTYFPFVILILAVVRLRLGRDPEPFSPIYHVRALAGRPVLFLSGSKDRLMPLEDVRALYEAAKDPKELWVVPEGTHGHYPEAAGEDYPRRITDFFEKNLS